MKDVFNPYADHCPLNDKKDAAAIRRKNLYHYLDYQFQNNPTQLWLAEAGSYQGLRRTGLPLVPETLLETDISDIRFIEDVKKATNSRARPGYSTKIVWQEAIEQDCFPFLWNTMMAHPYTNDNAFKNRTPTHAELDAYLEIIQELLDTFKFEHIICIGRKAELAVKGLEIPYSYVRHPAQGGARIFRASIAQNNRRQ